MLFFAVLLQVNRCAKQKKPIQLINHPFLKTCIKQTSHSIAINNPLHFPYTIIHTPKNPTIFHVHTNRANLPKQSIAQNRTIISIPLISLAFQRAQPPPIHPPPSPEHTQCFRSAGANTNFRRSFANAPLGHASGNNSPDYPIIVAGGCCGDCTAKFLPRRFRRPTPGGFLAQPRNTFRNPGPV